MTVADVTTDRWQQFVYGKLVQQPGGPIVPGSEHGCTGRSPDFPPELYSECHPSRLGLGERDPRRWAQCSWADVGGVVSGVAFAGGEPWVLAGRLRERSEAGEGVEGRLYSEALYAAMPARRYSLDGLSRLAPFLRAQPRESYDMALPTLAVPGDGGVTELPADWLDRTRLLLRGVASGEPINVQDWELRPEEFLRIASWCLAALPPTLRWRLPIGAGMITMDRATAIAYGMAALGGVRVIGGVARNEAETDLARGDKYVEWLARVTSGCASVGDVSEMIERELPHLVPIDAIDAREPWHRVAHLVADTVAEKAMLVQVLGDLVPRAATDVVSGVRFYRAEWVEELVRRATGLDSAAITRTLAETVRLGWQEAWKVAIARASRTERDRLEALAMMLGVTGVDRPEALVAAAATEVGETDRDAVVTRLAKAVTLAADGRPWLPLLRHQLPNEAAWVSAWCDAAMPDLVWLGIRDAVAADRSSSSLLEALREHPLVGAAVLLLKGARVEAPAIASLMSTARPEDRPAIDALIRKAAPSSAWRAYHIAELALERGIQTALSHPAAGRHGRTDEGAALVAALAQELSADRAPWPVPGSQFPVPEAGSPLLGPLMLRDILARRGVASASSKGDKLRETIARLIGDPYATALLGHSPLQALGPMRDVAAKYCLQDLQIGDDVAERLIQAWSAFAGESGERAIALLRRWLTITNEGTRGFPIARAVRTLAGNGAAANLQLQDDQRDAVIRAVTALRIDPVTMLRTATDEPLLEITAELWPEGKAMALRQEQLHAVLRVVLDDPRRMTRWRSRIERRRWANDPGWRWINRTARDANDVERAALESLEGDDLLAFVLEGLPVPPTLATHIGRPELDRALRGESGGGRSKRSIADRLDLLRKLLHFAQEARAEPLIAEVAQQALQLARDDGLNKRDVLRELESQGGIFGRPLLSFVRPPQTPMELLRAAIRASKKSPEAFVAEYWDGTRGKSGKRG